MESFTGCVSSTRCKLRKHDEIKKKIKMKTSCQNVRNGPHVPTSSHFLIIYILPGRSEFFENSDRPLEIKLAGKHLGIVNKGVTLIL